LSCRVDFGARPVTIAKIICLYVRSTYNEVFVRFVNKKRAINYDCTRFNVVRGEKTDLFVKGFTDDAVKGCAKIDSVQHKQFCWGADDSELFLITEDDSIQVPELFDRQMYT
jgi:hypothetical protein